LSFNALDVNLNIAAIAAIVKTIPNPKSIAPSFPILTSIKPTIDTIKPVNSIENKGKITASFKKSPQIHQSW
jgi:hypothetical protein